jgi:hypothetical protein
MRPLCFDLFCGLGGWAEGFLAEGYDVVGFDIERHEYWMPDVSGDDDGHKHTKPVEKRGWTQGCAVSLGMEGPNAQTRRRLVSYPGQLVIQDVLTLHGSQFKDAAVIVASPPCQNYSYLAMPWSRSSNPENSKAAKALRRKWETEGPDNRLFDACFRIQREACEAAGRYIPLIVENVRGAQPWVGRSVWNYGSFHLWGDVPALMPIALKVPPKRAMDDLKYGQRKLLHQHLPIGNGPLGRNDGTELKWSGSVAAGIDAMRGRKANPAGQKVPVYSDPRRNGGKGVHLTSPHENENGLKDAAVISQARKAASAQIAKIPFPLAQHIAAVYKPRTRAVA